MLLRRYNDNGLQFQFGSADFSGMTFFPDGTFEFKNGYRMEFSSARQFVEQSEGLFDDLKGTYEIIWGEMKESDDGKKIRRLHKLPEKKEQLRQPKRPNMESKRRSSRLLGLNSMQSMSSVLKKMGSVRLGGVRKFESSKALGMSESFSSKSSKTSKTEGAEAAGNTADEEEDKWIYTPLEIILYPSDMEARRKGVDLTQRWGCYEPEGPGNKVIKIQRKLAPTALGPFVFPESDETISNFFANKDKEKSKDPELK